MNEDGAPADPPLSRDGHEQAVRMAFRMQRETIDRLYSSPMNRAYQTAEHLARLANKEIEVKQGLAEFDRQDKDYIPVEELKELNHERWVQLMRGEAGVDFDEFSCTVIQGLEHIVRENKGKRVAIICHGGVINVWTAHIIGFPPRLFFYPGYTSINRFMCASSGERSVITLNETAHLHDVTG